MEYIRRKKAKRIIPLIILGVIAILWCSGAIPKQIARIAGTYYVRTHFPEMQLSCTGVKWAEAYGDYLISFKALDGSEYGCVIGPAYFPVSIGQGRFAIESDYAEKLKGK